MKTRLNDQLSAHARLWRGEAGPDPQTRLFRRTFELPAAAASADLLLYAEAIYNVWVNGHYLSRGPIFHHPTRLACDRFDVKPYLIAGRNVIAVVVHTQGLALHNSVLSGEPGLVADLSVVLNGGSTVHLPSNTQWRCTDQTGWQSHVPRRGWALGYVECFDTREGTQHWHALDFDDSQWPPAEEHHPASTDLGAEYVEREVPALRNSLVAPEKMIGLFSIADPPMPLDSKGPNLATLLMQARWTPPENGLQIGGSLESSGGTGLLVSGLEDNRGAVVCFDLGQEYVGQIVLECDCPSGGVIDIGWSEIVENHRPVLCRKGVSYVDRILAGPGPLTWQPINFSGARYLALCFRQFSGSIRLRKVGLLASEPDVNWPGSFTCSDHRLNKIWEICQRSLRVGTQEGLMDCPTREQAPYVGDGHLIGRWFTQLTGDSRHWRYLVREQFRRQSPGGLVRSSVFSGCSDTLIDYSLLAIIGTRDYCQFTGDVDSARDLREACRKTLAWFTSRQDDRGILKFDWKPGSSRVWENRYDSSWPSFPDPASWNLFIDHPGMGWHNIHEAGIDRRGSNAAINSLIVMAQQALADLEETVGHQAEADALRARADRLASTIRDLFYDPQRQIFSDGIVDGRQLSQISEQTNTWAIAAGCCDRATASSILQKLLNGDDPLIARNGPYFCAYLMPLLLDLGLTPLALNITRDRWGRMVDGGASTLWETFNGDAMDSWCHPWSAAPIELCLSGILGLPRFGASVDSVQLRPRYDLISEASGAMVTPLGLMSLRWLKPDAHTVILSGRLPNAVEATVLDSAGQSRGLVRGDWELCVRDCADPKESSL